MTAVWSSWNSDKAIAYRRLSGLSDKSGTAVTVQRMVYGNAEATSGAGVGFTRDPASGEPALYIDFMFTLKARTSSQDGEGLWILSAWRSRCRRCSMIWRRCAFAGQWLSEGEILSLDGETGVVLAGAVTVEIEKPSGALARVALWRTGRARSILATIGS